MEGPSGEQHKQERALRAIQVAAVSGFLEDNRTLQESCLSVCNLCRACVPLRCLRVDRDIPSTLLAMFWPGLLCAKAEGGSRVLLPRRVIKVDWRFEDEMTWTYLEDGEWEEEEEEAGVEREEEEEGVNWKDEEGEGEEEKAEEGGEEDKVDAEEKEGEGAEETREGEEEGEEEEAVAEEEEEEGEDEEQQEEGMEEEEDEGYESKEETVECDTATACDIDMSKMRWPEGVKEIYLWGFNRRIDELMWPVGLEVLSFQKPLPILRQLILTYGTAGIFNEPLSGVTFPAGLREMFLGHDFDQCIDDVAWPEGLERLSMPYFNRPIHDVQWPSGLKTLEFMTPYPLDDRESREEASLDRQDGCFNQPLGSFLPTNLEALWLSNSFYKPLRGVAWPSGLAVLGLGAGASASSLEGVKWPPRLQTLVLSNVLRVMEAPPPDCRIIYTHPQDVPDSDEYEGSDQDEVEIYQSSFEDENYDSPMSDFSL